VELVKTGEGRVDLVTGLSPLETLRVAESPFAAVVKNRGALVTVFGQFNMRKAGSPWHDVRLRQAVNYAINREDLMRYATKGNGEIIPALIPRRGYGYDPDLAPYAFDPTTARRAGGETEAGGRLPPRRRTAMVGVSRVSVVAVLLLNSGQLDSQRPRGQSSTAHPGRA